MKIKKIKTKLGYAVLTTEKTDVLFRTNNTYYGNMIKAFRKV